MAGGGKFFDWGWARGLSVCWWGNGLPRRRRVAGLRGRPATLGLRHGQTPTGGSSGGYCTMGETLMQRRSVRDDGLRVVNRFQQGRSREVTVPAEEVPANYVPAAAVIRRVRAWFGISGRKALVGGWSGLVWKRNA